MTSTTATARNDHAAGLHATYLATTPAERAALASSCALCARIWNPVTGGFRAEESARVQPKPVYNPTTRTSYTPSDIVRPTDAQLKFLKTLTADRDLTAVQGKVEEMRSKAVKGQMTKRDASDLITLLKDQPRAAATWNQSRPNPTEAAPTVDPRPRKPFPKVAEGYYALTLDSLEGTGFRNGVNFFHVTRPTTGAYAGRIFLSILASDAHHKVYGDLARAVLEGIAADPTAAQMLFAKESEHCFKCNRRLTDDESRARGMGSTCAGRD